MHALDAWFETPLGQYVLAAERAYLDATLPDIFGYYALQLGLPTVDLLAESRMPNRIMLAIDGGNVRSQLSRLPIASQSVDLVVVPHAFEFAVDPHDVLREVDRVLRPEGRAVIVGFNPWSLWGVARLVARGDQVPWNGRFVSLPRIKDWLQLLGYEISAGRLACYAPPFASATWRNRFSFMEAAGDRWWGVGGGVYMLQAIKRVQGMRLLTPAWADQRVRQGKLAVAKRSVHLRLVK